MEAQPGRLQLYPLDCKLHVLAKQDKNMVLHLEN